MGMFAAVLRRKTDGKPNQAPDEPPAVYNPRNMQGVPMRFTYGNGDQPLSGYVIKRGVGIGGFGEVYFATNEAGKEVALKRIQRNLDVEVRGVKQCINLRHPNLVGLYDIRFDDSGQGWIVMEYIAGESLRDLLDRSPNGFSTEEAIQRFSQLAAGVAYLHDQGIVHRDLKPANIFIDGGLVKIGDYGLSKFISCSRRGGQTESVGTFHYMAPEIGKGEYGKEIDIYALGIILYEMLTGSVPFDGESGQEIILKHLTADPDVRNLAEPFASVIAKSLAKNPSSRYSDLREMLDALGMMLDPAGLASRKNPERIADREAIAGRTIPVHAAPQAHPFQEARRSPEIVFGPVNHTDPQSPGKREDDARVLTYNEPIARMLQSGYFSAQQWWSSVPMAGSARGIILAVAIIFFILNSGWIISLFVTGLLFYVPYYCLWYMFTGGQGSHSKVHGAPKRPIANSIPPVLKPIDKAPTPPMPLVAQHVAKPIPRTIKPQPPKPISFRQWQVGKRRHLSLEPKSIRIHELSSSLLSSTGVLVVLSVIGGLIAVATKSVHQPGLLSAGVWTLSMAILGSWTLLYFGKRWEIQTEDRAIFRFKQLTLGLVIGLIAYAISAYLMVPWDMVSGSQGFPGGTMRDPEVFDELKEGLRGLDRHWNGFYGADGTPLLPAFVSYFALLFGGLRWWRQADSLRKNRFSYGSVLVAIVWAALIQILLPFPQPWGMMVAGSMAVAIQLSTRWIDSAERLQIENKSETKIA